MSTPAQGPATAPPSGAPQVSEARRALVEQARSAWIRKLIDLSRRNNLLYYRPLKTGTVDLSVADPEKMAALLVGESVPLSKLLAGERDQAVIDAVRNIARRALANAEEKGLQTLFVSVGMATWSVKDGGRPTEAPVLLLPVAVETKGSQSFSLVRTGGVQVNLVLLHVLETQFGVKLDPEELIKHLQGDDAGEPFNPEPVYLEILSAAGEVPGFDVAAKATLGNFAFQKMAMVKDLQERGEELARHDIVAAIAGDAQARAGVSATQANLDQRELDQVPPENEFVVLDADSSQQCAIAAIVNGQSGVVHGPPGTGKSQTIVNLIASLAATGKRILFVAEKRAALQVVQRRLKEIGLDHLAIDLHGADVSPRRVMDQVGRALDAVRTSPLTDTTAVHDKLVERRARLNAHVRRLHEKREPCAKSVYELQGALLSLGQNCKTAVRWRDAELRRLTPAKAERIRDLLNEAGGFAALFLRTHGSPWTGAALPDGKAVQAALDLSSRCAGRTWPDFIAGLRNLIEATGLKAPASMGDVKAIFGVVEDVQRTLEAYSAEIYRQNLPSIVSRLAPGKAGGLASVWAWCTNSDYRQARLQARAIRLTADVSAAALYVEITGAQEQLTRWKQLSDRASGPLAVARFGEYRSKWQVALRDVQSIGRVLPRESIEALPLSELEGLLRSLADDSETPHELPKLMSVEAELEQSGVVKLVADLRARALPPETWASTFDYAWYASTFDATCEQDPEIRGFKGNTHSAVVDQFVDLDVERLALAASRVQRAHAERAIAAMNKNPDQQYLIRAESQKVRRHLPLRKLFARAADVLTAVCPCWMASPLSISQLLDGGTKYFDYVIFDEASQVLPEDAIPAILRGGMTVVAGDRNQLPPTTFFAAGDDEDIGEKEAAPAEGYESLLDLMNSFLRGWYLDWHYRSRDESLISFSNHHIYQNRLVTFPGPGGPPVISHVLTQQEPGKDGEEESTGVEALKVVELVLEHARVRPSETLGVIAMGIRHASRVEAALDRALEEHPELHGFFDPNLAERFFVKNLERVQGDERDAIILTVGYGKDRAGNLPFRFGPLLSEGGRRRLNVAVTRARERLTLVSSFSHVDMDLSKVKPRTGVELLRDYLQYAASNGKRLGDAALTDVPPNDFETDVYDALSGRGIRLIPQMGVSRFRIDLVAEHRTKPGRYVLAIECDGASYHSSYTARDRDRLRQQQLENLGWRFHRIWSTDWFTRKSEEIERACKAFEEAVRYADQLDAGGPTSNGSKHESGSGQKLSDDGALPARGRRPAIAVKPSIGDYRYGELASLVGWMNSDGQLRTDDEIIAELVPQLGFKRCGRRIEAAIRVAIDQWRRRPIAK